MALGYSGTQARGHSENFINQALSGTTIIPGGNLQWSTLFKSTLFHWNKYLKSSFFKKVLNKSQFPLKKSNSSDAFFQIYCTFAEQKV